MQSFSFAISQMPPQIAGLRRQVRQFLAREMPGRQPLARAQSWTGYDAEFSRKLGEQGWIGMLWPKRYGGHERHPLERYVVLEELLVAGAPVAAHWIADRQSGPLLLRFGSEAQRMEFLPAIARGDMYFCIGLSEPGAGSDLAALHTRAVKVDGGWRVNGSKLWTTGADKAHRMIALVRTDSAAQGKAEDRHAGLSQLIIDMKGDGVHVRPITDMLGECHFNEVFFDDVFVPDAMLIGVAGNGWAQGMTELSLERSGPERYLSAYQMFHELMRAAGPAPGELVLQGLGRLAGELWTIRQMSLSVSQAQALGQDPMVEAAIVKDLGALFEQELPRTAQALLDEPMAAANPALVPVMEYLLQASVSFSLRGGTREILRGIVARGLGVR